MKRREFLKSMTALAAGSVLPAASAVIDLRKSRRFMVGSRGS